MIDPAYYTGTHGDRQTAQPSAPEVDVGAGVGFAAERHPFYERLNRILDDAGFDAFVESQCGEVPRRGCGPPEPVAGPLFPVVVAWIL